MPEPITIETARRWLRLPAKAVRVRATLQGSRGVGRIEETLLRLLAARRLTTDDLEERLCLPRDVLWMILNRLATEGWISEATDGSGWYAAPDAAPTDALRTVGGWMIVAPHDLRPIPRVWLGGKLPPRREEDGLNCPRPWPETDRLEPRRLDGLLARHCLSAELITLEGDNDQPALTPDLVCALLRETRSGESRIADTSCWAAVELVPKPSGSATIVVREPDILPGVLPLRPLSNGLRGWLEIEQHEAWEEILRHARAMETGRSLVLQMAGIEGEAALDQAVTSYFDAKLEALRFDPGRIPDSHAEVAAGVRDAERWLLIHRRNPAYHTQTRDAYGHAVERLSEALGNEVVPTLRAWVSDYERCESSDRQAIRQEIESLSRLGRRLRACGLEGRLGSSDRHLRKACRSVDNLRVRIRSDEHGAGTRISLWLLGIILPQDEQGALAHGHRVYRSLACHPGLFDDLDMLVDVRNDVFHERGGRGLPCLVRQPEVVDDYFVRTWTALMAGLPA